MNDNHKLFKVLALQLHSGALETPDRTSGGDGRAAWCIVHCQVDHPRSFGTSCSRSHSPDCSELSRARAPNCTPEFQTIKPLVEDTLNTNTHRCSAKVDQRQQQIHPVDKLFSAGMSELRGGVYSVHFSLQSCTWFNRLSLVLFAPGVVPCGLVPPFPSFP